MSKEFASNEHNFSKRQKVGLFLAIAATSGVFVAPSAAKAFSHDLKVSEEVASHMVKPNESLFTIAADNVKGSEHVDLRTIVDHIEDMPENQATLEDGKLDMGETIVHPVSVE